MAFYTNKLHHTVPFTNVKLSKLTASSDINQGTHGDRIDIGYKTDDGVQRLVVVSPLLFCSGIVRSDLSDCWQMRVSLGDKDGMTDEQKAFMQFLDDLHGRCSRLVYKSKNSLSDKGRKKLKKCTSEDDVADEVNALYKPSKDEKYAPTLFAKLFQRGGGTEVFTRFQDQKGRPVEFETLQVIDKKPVYFRTAFGLLVDSIFAGGQISIQMKVVWANVELRSQQRAPIPTFSELGITGLEKNPDDDELLIELEED